MTGHWNRPKLWDRKIWSKNAHTHTHTLSHTHTHSLTHTHTHKHTRTHEETRTHAKERESERDNPEVGENESETIRKREGANDIMCMCLRERESISEDIVSARERGISRTERVRTEEKGPTMPLTSKSGLSSPHDCLRVDARVQTTFNRQLRLLFN